MTDKERYRELCKQEKTIPIFSRDWWMDAVCGEDNWDVIVVDRGNKIVAAMPYHFVRRKKGIVIRQPQLTQTNGVWISYPDNQKYSKKLSFEKEVMNEIIDKLEKLTLVSFNQSFKYTITNWLPFYWRGFKQTTRYSYILENLDDLEMIFSNFDHAKRKNIKKAEKLVTIKYDLGYKEFYENHEMTLLKQNSKIGYSLELFQKIYEAAYDRNQGKTFYAVDTNNNIHAAIFIIWDENSAYDLISTIDPEFRDSGAASLVVMEAIKYVSTRTEIFDFEGSMIENVENSFRQFGAFQKPYFNICKHYGRESIPFAIAKAIKDNSPAVSNLLTKLRGR